MEVSEAAAMRTDRAGRMFETVPGPNNDWSSGYQIGWDAWSRIVKAEAPAEEMSAEYAYDGMARRITRSVAGQPVVHSYYNDEWRPLEDRRDSETTAAASYLWGSRHRDDLVRRDRAVGGTTLNESRYILMDYFSPAAITDESGAVTERYQFSAFGLRTILNPDFTVRSSSECGMEFAFQGQFEDAETGWLNYGFRYYLPALGRWPSRDPINERGGINLYTLKSNQPVNALDYLGLVGSEYRMLMDREGHELRDPILPPPKPTHVPGTNIPYNMDLFDTARAVADFLTEQGFFTCRKWGMIYKEGYDGGHVQHCMFGCLLTVAEPAFGLLSGGTEITESSFQWGDLKADYMGFLYGLLADGLKDCEEMCKDGYCCLPK